jgi:hypothetical protein
LLRFGMHDQEKWMLFKHLLLLSADISMQWEINTLGQVDTEMAAHQGVHVRPL